MFVGCVIDGQSHLHGSIFPAPDGCNSCVCSYGKVTCTNSTSCGQGMNISLIHPWRKPICEISRTQCPLRAVLNKLVAEIWFF